MLFLLDIFFDALHIGVILFNLTGWMFKTTRKAHRWLVGATAFCWLVVGPFAGGIGYCPLTEWHWNIKQARGIRNLPDSYIDYPLRGMNIHADPARIDFWVGATFAAVVIATGFAWRKERKNLSGARVPVSPDSP